MKFLAAAFIVATGILTAQGVMADEPDAFWYGEPRGIALSFVLPGPITSQREWSAVDTPRKFFFELQLDVRGSQVYFQVFDLQDKDGDWWLNEVMGFLFEPETLVSSEVTRNGYDLISIDIPGGAGVYPQTELLLVGDGAAFRFTCIQCRETGALPVILQTLDSFDTFRVSP